MQTAKAIQTIEQKVTAEQLRILRNFATSANIDLVGLAAEKFQVAPEDLTREQDLELLSLCLKQQPKPVLTHYHYCVECGSRIDCYEKDCTDSEGYDHCADEIESKETRWYHNKGVVMR
jgi:hypothetical protein